MPDSGVGGAGAAGNACSHHSAFGRRHRRWAKRPGTGEWARGLRCDPEQCANQQRGSTLPANASAPYGVVHFTASGCSNATLNVQVTYPAGSLSGLNIRKYGPNGTPRQMGWFVPANLAISTGAGGDVVTYSVTDNGEGDSDPTLGVITDPMAPLLL